MSSWKDDKIHIIKIHVGRLLPVVRLSLEPVSGIILCRRQVGGQVAFLSTNLAIYYCSLQRTGVSTIYHIYMWAAVCNDCFFV
jgi:hypothetical protein